MAPWLGLVAVRRVLIMAWALFVLVGLMAYAQTALGQSMGSGIRTSVTLAEPRPSAMGSYTPAAYTGQPEPQAGPSAATDNSSRTLDYIPYVVRPGDSVGSIAAAFQIPMDAILRRNRLSADSMLYVGQTLQIPNPFLAQINRLKTDIASLNRRNVALAGRADHDRTTAKELTAQIAAVQAQHTELQHQAGLLPWWRRVTFLALGAMILMLGVTALALYEWLRMRLWFSVLARANERLRRLDERYRAMVAKAELRFQQLYGRRKALTEANGKTPEEYEIERLNRELRQIIDAQLAEIGVPARGGARHWRLRDWLVGISQPAQIPPERR